jgi:hypothetical protein
MNEPIVLTPIGVVRGGRSQIFEDHWGGVVSRLVLDPAVLDQAATDVSRRTWRELTRSRMGVHSRGVRELVPCQPTFAL